MKNSLRTVVYIPIDDRPCNLDRVIMGAEAMGVNLLIPDKNYIRTCLDGQPLNSTGLQCGSPEHILEWVESLNTQGVKIDGFIVAVDQITSGGMVNGRTINGDGNNITVEMNNIARMVDAVKGRPAYFFDNLTRLASTVEYKGMMAADYNATRSYFSLKRKIILDDLEAIVNNYDKDRDGNVITNTYGLTQEKINGCIAARRRKFRINAGCANYLKQFTNIYHTIAVEDCNYYETVQENEIVYLESIMGANSLYAGIDEVGMCLVSRFVAEQLSPWAQGRLPRVKVSYFGGGENEDADEYDFRSLDFGVDKHINLCGGQRVYSNAFDINFLVLTQPKNGKTYAQNASDLHYQMNVNNSSNIPTIVVDASQWQYDLPKRLFGLNGATSTYKLLAYSGWNTVGNAIGLALGHGIGRFVYMTLGGRACDREALASHVKLLFTELVKDVCYKVGAVGLIAEDLVKFTKNSNFPYNFIRYAISASDNEVAYSSFLRMTTGEFNIHNIARVFTDGANEVYENYISPAQCKITKINWINYPYEDGTSGWFKLVHPWSRTYECTFPLNVSFK